MPTITLQEAQANLADLVHRLVPGELVTITENDRPIAQIVKPALASSELVSPPSQRWEPRDDWERRLFGAAVDCGVSFPDAALSSDGLYD